MKKFPILLVVLLVFSSFCSARKQLSDALLPNHHLTCALPTANFISATACTDTWAQTLWYGAILGSTGRGGNRERLAAELDLLQSIGVGNLRVLVGADGAEGQPKPYRAGTSDSPRAV